MTAKKKKIAIEDGQTVQGMMIRDVVKNKPLSLVSNILRFSRLCRVATLTNLTMTGPVKPHYRSNSSLMPLLAA